MELLDFELEGEGGEYVLSGQLHNIGLEPGSPVDVEFHFYSESGEEVAIENVSLEAPEQGTDGSFSITTASSEPVVGFSYQLAETEAQAAN